MSKKPAKTPTDFINKKVEVPGKSVRYIGIGGKVFSCPSCDRSFSRGMVFEFKDNMYCSRRCIDSV